MFQDVPGSGPPLPDELLRGLDRGRNPPLLELAEDEGLEELERHLLGETTLMKFQIGADNDHRPTGIIDPLPKEVLAEATLFTLQRVRQRLERAVVRTRDHAPTTTVVEQRVHGLLEHPLLVPDDYLRRLEVHEPLQPIVPVDDAAVQIVQVRSREHPAAARYRRLAPGRMSP